MKQESVLTVPDIQSNEVQELVRMTRAFYHIHDSGMFGGKHGAKEARRWQENIVNARKRLGLTKREATMLVNKLIDHNQHPLMTRQCNGNTEANPRA